MLAEPYRLTVTELVRGMRRRAVMILVVFTLIAGLAVGVATLFPPVYRSAGIILVESQQIPPDLVPTTVITYADERIQVIRQRIMTREHQTRIIDKYGLFADAEATMTVSEMLEAMRDSTEITPIHADSGKRGATIAFEIAFEHRSPETARAVANELVTLFLAENVRTRTERASETTQFLDREAAKLEADLSFLEAELAAHKQRYGDALPEHLELRMGMLQRVESELRNVQRESKTTLEEMRFMDVELSAAQAGLGPAAASSNDAARGGESLGELKRDYLRLSQLYTDRHPDLMVLSRRIQALEAAQAMPGDSPLSAGMTDSQLRVAKIQTRLDAAENRLASLRDQEQTLLGRIKNLEAQILKTPQVQRELSRLMRDYGNAQSKYEEMREKQINAEMAESLEQEEKAERFSLIEPPLTPESPVKPNRMRILLLGFFLAVGSSGGLAVMLETLSNRVRGPRALAHLAGQPPLVVIPHIATAAESGRHRAYLLLSLVAFMAVAAVTTVVVHSFYMPLDQLWLRVLAQFP